MARVIEKRRERDPEQIERRRIRNTARYQLEKGTDIDYKNIPLLQKYLNDRGKIVPRRISEISAKDQRKLVLAIKRARFLALLIPGANRRPII